MGKKETDIGRMILQSQLLQSASRSTAAGFTSEMERSELIELVRELQGTVQTLLESNLSLGKRLDSVLSRLDETEEENKYLRKELARYKGNDAASKRHRFGKGGEKRSGGDSRSSGKTKEERESDYIENGSKSSEVEPSQEDASSADDTSQADEPQKRDTSNRPDHYKKMHADIVVDHYCDIDGLSALGLTYIRDTKPVDQYDRISLIRQDRYHFVWVRDSEGNEFPYFLPSPRRSNILNIDESKYDMPRLLPHTSGTSAMISDLAVNRYQYALSVGREKIRMFNEKMQMASQTVLNWLGAGADYLRAAQNWIKKSLLRQGSTIYSDETWVNVREVGTDGRLHYVKRYMWVIVNATTKVCYYLFGNRSKSVITEFLNGFKGTMMTDAYAAYTYFNKVKDFMHLCCWAHVRRIFYSAKVDYKDRESESFISDIGLLYKVELENQLLHRDESEIVEARGQESIPILHKLKQDAELLLASGRAISSKLEQAINYMLNNWSQLINYVNVGNADIDNNICERAVRPFTVLRKNFGGFGGVNGAETASVYLTMVETCKLRGLSPKTFFTDFFDQIVAGNRNYEEFLPELLVKKI